ncbi:MAG: VWA domain-containing protein [Sandaracinaceae bacterium]
MRKTMFMAWFALGLSACGGATIAEEGEDPEVVLLGAELGNDLVMAGEPSEVVTRLRVETAVLEGAARPPINLALVIDTSGSMDGDPIADARAASLDLLSTLHPEDRLAVIAFHSETEVLLESTQLEGADLGELRSRIGRMEARGTTDLAGGLRAGLEEVVRHFEPDGINRLVLLSDGVPNDATQVLPLSQAAGERGIRITALGLGVDFDETLLAHVAQQSGGRFHYVEESSMVAGVFRDEVLRFERLLARNLRLELRPGPGVRIDGVVGQQITPMANGHVEVALGDLSEGEHRDVIVRMQAGPRRAGAAVELLDAVLHFDDAVQNAGRLERRAYLGARATSDSAEVDAHRNAEVERAAARMLAAATTVQAIEVAREGDIIAARQALAQAEAQARAAAEARADVELRAQADQMRVLRGALPSMAADAPAAAAEEAYYEEDAPAAGMAAPAPEPASVIRSAHGEAMRVLQSE